MTETEREEHQRLQACRVRIAENLQAIGARLSSSARNVCETKDYMWEARRDLDHIDKVAMRQAIDQKTRSAEVLQQKRSKLIKLQDSPYLASRHESDESVRLLRTYKELTSACG